MTADRSFRLERHGERRARAVDHAGVCARRRSPGTHRRARRCGQSAWGARGAATRRRSENWATFGDGQRGILVGCLNVAFVGPVVRWGVGRPPARAALAPRVRTRTPSCGCPRPSVVSIIHNVLSLGPGGAGVRSPAVTAHWDDEYPTGDPYRPQTHSLGPATGGAGGRPTFFELLRAARWAAASDTQSRPLRRQGSQSHTHST